MWREELHAFLVPVDGLTTPAGREFGVAHGGFIELPPFPRASQGGRPMQSTPQIVGRHTPCLYWALGNRLSCPRALVEVTSWSDTHAMPYPVPSLAPLHNAGVRVRCVDNRKCVQFCSRRSPPMEGVSASSSSAPRVGKLGHARALEESEHVWLEPGDRLIICDSVVVQLVVLIAVRASVASVVTPDPLGSPVMQVVSPDRTSGSLRVSLPPVPWSRLSRSTRVKLVAMAVERECTRLEIRTSHGMSSSSRADEELVHTNGPSSQQAERAVEVEEDCGAATPSRQASQLAVTNAPVPCPAETRRSESRSVSPRSKARRVELLSQRDEVNEVSTRPPHRSTAVQSPHESGNPETLDAFQLRSRSSQVAASIGTDTVVANGNSESFQSADSGQPHSDNTVLAKNSYLETFDEHLNEALLQLENKSAEMSTNWLLQTTALLGVGGNDVLGDDPLQEDTPSKRQKSVSPVRTSPKTGTRGRRKSKSTTPRGAPRRGTRSRGRSDTPSKDTSKRAEPQQLPFASAAESQEVFFQH